MNVELLYPSDQFQNFSGLFSVLENSNNTDEMCTAPELGVKSYAVSMTTLEEVFLKLGEEENLENGEDSDEKEQASQNSQVLSSSLDRLEEVGSTNVNIMEPTLERNAGKFFVERQQFLALIKVLSGKCDILQ